MVETLGHLTIIGLSAMVPFGVVVFMFWSWWKFLRPEFHRSEFIVKLIGTIIFLAVVIILLVGLSEISINNITYELEYWHSNTP